MAAERKHLELRSDTGYYRYVRKVPDEVAHLDPRRMVREGLKTKDPLIAERKARAMDESLEAYWSALLAGRSPDEAEKHQAALRLVKSMGFTYQPASAIIAAGRDAVIERLLAVIGKEAEVAAPRAILGTANAPEILVSKVFDLYLEHKQGDLEGYSPSQIKKHKAPKQRASIYLQEVLGDKPLADITRQDAIAYKAWWVDKIAKEGLTVDAANRSFSDIKGMLSVIDKALETEFASPWARLNLKGTAKTKSKKRLPYPNEFVQAEILRPGALDNVNFEARMIFYCLIETGARPSEICNILPAQIHLEAELPYIDIIETDGRILKTESSVRMIPLVGVSLWAMRQVPNGFPSYRDKEDSFSATMNKALRTNKLKPTPRHTVYSMRHTFQDRILAAGASDRLQTDLMGHEFGRPKYGDGAELKQKLELLERIKFQWAAT